MTALFHAYIYEPILSVLVFLYSHLSLNDLGVSIVELTILIRFILLPIFYKSTKDQTILQRLQPRIKKIQTDHKEDKERQAKELMALYREHRVNPFTGFFLLLIQLPVFIALFQIFTTGIGGDVFQSKLFLGILDLGAKNWALVVVAAVLQFLQSKMMLAKQPAGGGNKGNDPAASMQKIMLFAGPLLTVVILGNLPAAIGLYWLVSNMFSLVQQIYINKKIEADVPKGV